MRTRGIRAVLAALVAVGGMAVTGCGVVGNPLADKAEPSTAAPSPSTEPFTPAVGACLALEYRELIDSAVMRTVGCDQPHYSEIVHVGQFTGAAAQLSGPPILGDQVQAVVDVQRAVYEDCTKQADLYLGRPYYEPGVRLRVGLPYPQAWQAGARWYVCDLQETPWYMSSGYAESARSGSRKTRAIEPTCVDMTHDMLPAVDCATRHTGEFIGGYLAPATADHMPTTEAELAPMYDECYRLAAAYLATTADRARQVFGMAVWRVSDGQYWTSGRRSVLCYLTDTDQSSGTAQNWGLTHPQ